MAEQAQRIEALSDPKPGPLILDRPDLWNDPRFRAKLLLSLEAEGFEAETVALVDAVLGNADTPTFEAFCVAAARHASGPGRSNAQTRLVSVFEHWRTHRNFNRAVYRPRSKEDHIARFWPNNPKLLQTHWEMYADIFEMDLFTQHNRFITPETPIASAGSCFAANISRQLQHWNYNYLLEMGLSKDHFDDPRFYATDPAGCGNIYNAVSMRMMVERAFGLWTPEKILMAANPRIIDPFRSAKDFNTLEEYEARWEEHNAALKRALTRCEVFILTLGMTEIWKFADSGLSTAAAPTVGDPTLVRYHNLTVDENVAELERIYALFQEHNPRCKFITSVSPVPLNATFNKDANVVVANGLSKSVLRVALDIFSNNHPETVFYFPSYEAVTMGTAEPWEIDRRHVSNTAVARVMRQFQRQFLVDQEPLDIIQVAELQTFIPMRRNPALRYAREWLVHPLKRALGIEGRPFRTLLKKR
ncbi:MAG: GSCFA domain-containing protein [Alphaproteobacteria bacterium]